MELYENRFSEGSRSFANHEVRIEMLESYQVKQNGALQRLETKFDENCKWLNRWIYSIGVGVIMTLVALVANLLR